MKKNNKGFVLVETLVVTVFVMAVFSVIYLNFYPLVGEYERRESYDDVDSKYGSYWMKRFIQGESYPFSAFTADVTNRRYHVFSCDEITAGKSRTLCTDLKGKLHIKNVYITDYNLANFKTVVSSSTAFSEEFKSYVEYLPEYRVASLNNANYRVLVEFERQFHDNVDAPATYHTYSTMEVVKR